MKKLLLLVPLLFALLACDLGVTVVQDSHTTPTAASPNFSSRISPQPSPTFTPEPSTGTILGRLSYPSEMLPPMRVVAFSLTDGKAYFVDSRDEGHYSLEVPAGIYYVVSYVYKDAINGNRGEADSYTLGEGMETAGGYTQMVPCGLKVGCDDHSLLPVTVVAGQTTEEIHADDWYAPSGTFPPMPNP